MSQSICGQHQETEDYVPDTLIEEYNVVYVYEEQQVGDTVLGAYWRFSLDSEKQCSLYSSSATA